MAIPPATPMAGRRDAFCRNCGVPLLGEHCHACGQAAQGLVRPMARLLGDALDSLFELDSRLLRTLPALLFRPGWLSTEYLAGRRARYVSPVRLFVFLCIATFFAAGLATPAFDIGSGDGEVQIADTTRDAYAALDTEAAVIARHDAKLAGIAKGRAETARMPGMDAVMDMAESQARPGHSAPGLGLTLPEDDDEPVINFNGQPWHATDNPLVVGWLPEVGNRWLNAQIGHLPKNWKRIREDPGLLNKAFYSALPSAVFVLVPVFALLLKGLYLFTRRLYMEHLVVSLHGHAFLCATGLLLVGLSVLEGLADGLLWLARPLAWLQGLLWLWIPAYLWLLLQRVYRQGWLMTSAKFLLLGAAEAILLSLVAGAALLVALVWL
ncbi:DUF3667 domain-containing protein [Silanimonas lenta]|uniref:DUF3667 domain-containing protein n=1 Tax=Silanimonas lenta TaxID=265429 RepID=UPI0003F99CD0|nr:DUF3667 domain-containing protein [Silanimonas lenta]